VRRRPLAHRRRRVRAQRGRGPRHPPPERRFPGEPVALRLLGDTPRPAPFDTLVAAADLDADRRADEAKFLAELVDEKALVAAGSDMPRNSFTESKNERDAALVPDANVAADTSSTKTKEIRPIRRNFDDLLIAEEWDDGVIELSDFLDINN